jgi:hypothetical protein
VEWLDHVVSREGGAPGPPPRLYMVEDVFFCGKGEDSMARVNRDDFFFFFSLSLFCFPRGIYRVGIFF